ncbi:hypothetical protein [Rubinisphaera italica]|uniref:hypothetical protein n=1 Tax=Rubinisphaera italica TaxID=2527969 RepID=UPI0011B39B24|nr:hypothetical protein [Rubinisphaera italica]
MTQIELAQIMRTYKERRRPVRRLCRTESLQTQKLRRQLARKGFKQLLEKASRKTLRILNLLLARLCETSRTAA